MLVFPYDEPWDGTNGFLLRRNHHPSELLVPFSCLIHVSSCCVWFGCLDRAEAIKILLGGTCGIFIVDIYLVPSPTPSLTPLIRGLLLSDALGSRYQQWSLGPKVLVGDVGFQFEFWLLFQPCSKKLPYLTEGSVYMKDNKGIS